MQTVMPETERTEAEINEPVERLPEPKQPEMTRMASKYPRFIRFTMNWNSRTMQFIRKRNNVLPSKKELSEIKGWFKGRKQKRIAGRNRRYGKPDPEYERLSSEDRTESWL